MVKAYLIFCKHNGDVPNYQESQIIQKAEEWRTKYGNVLDERNQLSMQLAESTKEVKKLEQKIASRKKSLRDKFLDYWVI